jgi:hypothetical protein
MDLDSLLRELREEERAESGEFYASIREEVWEQIRLEKRRRPSSGFQDLLNSWLALLHDPRWIGATVAVITLIAVIVSNAGFHDSKVATSRAMLSLNSFEPFAPHTPERMLVGQFSSDE